MTLATTTSSGVSVHARLKLSRLMGMSERDFETKARALEEQDLFRRLVSFGVIRRQSYAGARFSASRLSGWELRSNAVGFAGTLDGNGAAAELMRQVGQERFEECFLRADGMPLEERAERCGLSIAQARQLMELIDKLYIQEEFAGASPDSAPTPSFSAVAGVELDAGHPVLAFFNREIWQNRYRVDDVKRGEILAALGKTEAVAARRMLSDLHFIELRKSTLYRVLETVIEVQALYLASGDPQRRRPLTQRAVAARLGVESSTLHRLIANKSVQLPWGLQAPLKVFMPSSKLLARERLYDIAVASPEATDAVLCAEMRRIHGVVLSRRSIAQYRKELGLQRSAWRGLSIGAINPCRPNAAAMARI